LFQGRFGRMFRSLPAAQYGNSETESRSNLMTLEARPETGFLAVS
jgi:hypothetical protein